MTAASLLAYNPNDVRPGWGALVLVLVLIVVVYLLWRSMNTQLGRIQVPSRRPPDTRIPGASDPAGEPAAGERADTPDVGVEGDERPPPAAPPPT
jgi:hypothetical protein